MITKLSWAHIQYFVSVFFTIWSAMTLNCSCSDCSYEVAYWHFMKCCIHLFVGDRVEVDESLFQDLDLELDIDLDDEDWWPLTIIVGIVDFYSWRRSGPCLIKIWYWSQLICDWYQLQRWCTHQIGDCKLAIDWTIRDWFGSIATLYKTGPSSDMSQEINQT